MMKTCPSCNQPVEEVHSTCAHCGYAFEAAPVDLPDTVPGRTALRSGRLVLAESGLGLNLLPGKDEILLGRTDPVSGIYPEIDLTGHGGDISGVSRRHARLVFKPEGLFLEDLNSTNFTFLNRRRLQPGRLYPVQDGDEIRLGNLVMTFQAR